MSNDKAGNDSGNDEVLTPEVVDGAPPPPAPTVKGPEEKRATYALYLGFGSLFFLFLLPIPLLVALCAGGAIYLGAKVLRAVDPVEGSLRTRKRGKIGMVAGITTVVIYAALAVYYLGFYEAPDKSFPDLAGETTGEPAG